VIELFRIDGVLIVKVNNTDYCLKILVCYRKNDLPTAQYLNVAYELDLILGDFNLKPNHEVSSILIDFRQVVLQPTHIAGATLDHVYIKNVLFENLRFDVSVMSISFSDHEMVKIRMGRIRKCD